MLELLRSDVALFLALSGILIAMFFPIVAVWIALSIRRDIHRIALALAPRVQRLTAQETVDLAIAPDGNATVTRRVANSAFGR